MPIFDFEKPTDFLPGVRPTRLALQSRRRLRAVPQHTSIIAPYAHPSRTPELTVKTAQIAVRWPTILLHYKVLTHARSDLILNWSYIPWALKREPPDTIRSPGLLPTCPPGSAASSTD